MMMLMIAMDWTGYLLNDDDYDDRVKMMMIRTIRLRSGGRLYELNDDDDDDKTDDDDDLDYDDDEDDQVKDDDDDDVVG